MKNTNQNQGFYSVKQLADLMGISRIAVFNKIKKGQISAQKIGRSYAIPKEAVFHILQDIDVGALTEERKQEIKRAVEKLVKEYGTALKMLGKE